MLLSASPTLASLNIEKTIAFYESFDFVKEYQDQNYAIMSRDSILLHFWKCNDKIHPQNTSCYVYVSEIDSLYSQVTAINAVHPNSKLHDTPYGIKEFAMLDIHGNLIRFGEKIG